MESLTKRQAQVLRFLQREWAERGAMPSVRRIAAHLRVRSPNGVMGHLRALMRKGYLQRQSPETSAFQLAGTATHSGLTIPLVATVPAGTPQMAYDQADQLDLSPAFFGHGDVVAIRVAGESMAGDAILDGDIGIIQLQSEALPHEIVAVRVGRDEVTLKRIRRCDAWIELIPSNPECSVRRVPADEVEIVGKLTGIIRRT